MNSQTENKSGVRLIAYYGRVSTSNQEDQKTIDIQVRSVEELAKKKFGEGNFIVVKKYLDEGWSGDRLERPNLDTLRIDANKRIWDAVLIYDPDRLARRYSLQELVIDELREKNIDVLFCTRTEPTNPIEEILFGVQGLFAEYERAKIADRFRLGKIEKAQRKNIVASEAPYGYTLMKRVGKPKLEGFVETHYVINEYEANIVRKIFAWVANDKLTIRKVIRKLHAMAVRPRKSKKGTWGTTTISTMLKNETYIGQGYYNKSLAILPENRQKRLGDKYRKVIKTSRKFRARGDWIPIPTPAILVGEEGKALFESAQAQLKENFTLSQRNKKNNYLLAERFRCTCGCTRTGEGPQQGKYLYYRCSSRIKTFPLPPSCDRKGINARIADEQVWEKIIELARSSSLMRDQLSLWHKSQENSGDERYVDVEILKKEILNLKKQISRHDNAYGGGVYTLERLQEVTNPLQERIIQLEKQINEAQSFAKKIVDTSVMRESEVDFVATKAVTRLKDLNFERKRAIVLDVIDRVVGEPGHITVFGRLPVQIISPFNYAFSFMMDDDLEPYNYVNNKTIGRYCGSSQRW